MKKCSKCQLVKYYESFGKNTSKKDGYRTECKDCDKKQGQRYYLKHKTSLQTRVRDNNIKCIDRNKKFIIDYLKLNPCVGCGITDIRVLEFDHIDRSNKLERVSALVTQGYSLKLIKEEIAKCQVLCANCHRIKTVEEFGHFKSLKNL